MPTEGVISAPEEKRWRPLELGWIKLNTDGSFSMAGNAGAGMILRDHRGNVNVSACRVLYSCRDALETELCACMEGVSLALQRSDLPIVVEMDSLEAVTKISCEDADRSIYASIVKEIKYLLSLRQSCRSIIHIAWTQNKASDALASFARLQGRTMTWLGAGPDEVMSIVNLDCKNTSIE